MKNYLIILLVFISSSIGFSQEVTFEFDLTPVANTNDGSIVARIAGVSEETEVICILIGTGEVPIDDMHFDFGTEEYVVTVNNLTVGDYEFRVTYEGQEYTETVHLNQSATNPLSVTYTVQDQLGQNNGNINAVITTGSSEPTVVCTDQNNVPVTISSSNYDQAQNTLTIDVTNIPAGTYTFTINDGTNYLASNAQVSYQVVSLTAELNAKHVLNSNDGEVTATIMGGTQNSVVTFNKHGDPSPISFTSTFSQPIYQKTIVASNLDEGVYEIHVSENGFDIYDYVWVGKYGATTTLSVQPDANFGIDACLRSLNRPGYTHLANTNYGNYANMLPFHGTHGGYPNKGKNVIKFQYNGLGLATLDEVKLNVWGWHYRNQGQGGGYANEVYVRRIDNASVWGEHTVTWNTQPLAVTQDQGIISSYGASTYANVQYTKDVIITNLVSEQLKSGNVNNGFLIGLMTDNRYRSQYFYSSDYTVSAKRPKLTITFTLPEAKPFVSLKNKLDGGFVTLDDRKLRFVYQEDYKDQDAKLTYKIFNNRHELVMSDVLNTTLIPAKRVDVNNVKYGQNRVVLNINCCLACGEYFILEVTNEKNEKKYLRIKTAPALGGEVMCHPCGSQVGCATSSGGSGS